MSPPEADLPALDGPDGLVRAGPARRRPFALRAPGGLLRGDELGGVEAAELGGETVLEGLRNGAGVCSNVLVSPRALRRELVGPGGTVLETLMVTERPAGVVAQWSPGPGGALALDLAWRHPGPTEAWRASEGRLVVGGAYASTVYAVRPQPERWEVEPGPDGLAVRVRARTREGPVTLLVLRGPAGELDATLARLETLGLHARRAATETEEARAGALALHTGLPEVDEGLEWAKARLRAGGDDDPGDAPDDAMEALWHLQGLLAAGEHVRARGRLPEAVAHPAHLLALGEAVRWTGDPGPFRRRADDLDREIETLLEAAADDPGGGGDRVLLRAGLDAAADAVEVAGDRDRAARWRRWRDGMASAGPAAEPRGPGALRLPMATGARAGAASAGAASDGAGAALLRAILGDGSWPRPETATPPADGVERGLRAWALYRGGDPDAAYLHLRAALDAQPTEATTGSAAAAALVPAVVANGLLGVRPDAAYGRARLAPALPAGWTRFRVTSLRFGDASLDLAYARDGDAHTFTLVPTACRVPPTVVLEPAVPLREIEEVRVDGRPADLERGQFGDRATARLQLPVDRERRVTLVGRGVG